jgi:glycosyltransferase involved in cell wall biosynthesis
MRLLIWASSYGQAIGGGPVLAPLLATALVRRGHEVTVLTDRRPESMPEEEYLDGVRIRRPLFRRALAGDVALIPGIRRDVAALKRETQPDLAFIFSSGYGEFFHHVTKHGQPMPLVVSLHDRFAEHSFGPEATVGRNLRAARWVTACSAAVLQRARQYLPALIPISSVIHNALPLPDLATWDGPQEGSRLAFAGRLIHKKGVDVLLAAIALLAGRFPRLHLAIAGEGDERSALEAEVARLGLAGRITFAGRLAHAAVYPFLATADVVVVPSRIEPFGLVALEAAQVKRPVIASAVDGLPEVVLHGETGLLVPPDDPPALAAAIADLIADPVRAGAMGAAARQRAETHFAWDRYVAAHEQLFAGILRS